MTQTEVEDLIANALKPLKHEIAELREKLSALSPQTLAPEPTTNTFPNHETPEPPAEPETSAPTERKDFQRFLQRGLEEEQVRYSEEAVSSKPDPKKGGWNPFRR
jgi:hypothetical protein